MWRHIRRQWLIGTAVVIGLIETSSFVQAQFNPYNYGFYYNNPYGSYGINYNPYNYNYSINSSFNYSWVNPFTRQPYNIHFANTYSGFPGFLYAGGFQPYYNPYNSVSPQYYQPRYNSSSMQNPIIRNQLKFFAGAQPAPVRVRNMQNAAGNNGAFNPVQAEGKPKGKPVATDPKLVSPADAKIQSGQVLTELVGAIRQLEKKGAKVDAPLLPAELLRKVQFAGSSGGRAIVILRDESLDFPMLLDRQEYLYLKTPLQEALKAITAGLRSGKAVPIEDATKLDEAVTKARTDLEPKWNAIPADTAAETKKFLTDIESLVAAAKDAALEGVMVPKWFTVGASASEVVQHLEKYKIAIGPSKPGDEQIYRAFHRGLVTYYKALAANGV